jgi:uncharacterized protein (TIGR02996 family)
MTELAFIDAILEAPDDPIHRQAYADWLEERGDPRAEFLRLQITSQDQAVKGRKALSERLRELQAGLDPHWVALMTGARKGSAKGEKGSRRERQQADVSRFLQQYGRRGRSLLSGYGEYIRNGGKRRAYDREIEATVQRMTPEDLDRLLRDEDG